MFTGIIKSIGSIVSTKRVGADLRLQVRSADWDMAGVAVGDSVAVNGVCLTAVEVGAFGLSADVSRETLALTTLGQTSAGDPVNLEPALTLATPLGGHLVSGHVDGIGIVVNTYEDGRSMQIAVAFPSEIARYIARKGSIAIDGVSLTVNGVSANQFIVNLVPHTRERTIVSQYRSGTKVNLEVDLIARYLERLTSVAVADTSAAPPLTKETLIRHGFL